MSQRQHLREGASRHILGQYLTDRAQEKQLKWLRKHPNRNLPIPTYPMNTSPTPMQHLPPSDPLSFMLMPTGEQFGVRRPFDAPGLPRSLGGPPGHAGWPMMSRTMTHVIAFRTCWGETDWHRLSGI